MSTRGASVEDYLSLLPSTLQWISDRLGKISGVPWPLWVGGLFPLYVAAVSTVVWILRGRAWPVRCAYPRTKRNRPCRSWVPGEWSRCRYHNRRTAYRYGHNVDTTVRRWQTIAKDGTITPNPLQGVGVLRLRPTGWTLLYERGYARPPMDVVTLVPTFVRRTFHRLGQMRWRDPTPDIAVLSGGGERDTASAGPSRTDVAAGLPEVVRATRFATVSFGIALLLTLMAVLVRGTAQTVVQYLATLGFVLAWAAISSGAYQRSTTWLRGACLKTFRWWALIFVPVGFLNLVFTVANARPPS